MGLLSEALLRNVLGFLLAGQVAEGAEPRAGDVILHEDRGCGVGLGPGRALHGDEGFDDVTNNGFPNRGEVILPCGD